MKHEDNSLIGLIEEIWRLPRDIISPAYDTALKTVERECLLLNSFEKRSSFKTHEYPTGTEAYTWIVPEEWVCQEAYLSTVDGKRIFSYEDHPLHCVSYSLPFNRIVSREELFRHLYTHPHLQDAIPFKFKYYERDWGLCCSEKIKNTLVDEKYKVVINTSFKKGTLKVGEFILPGKSEESFVLCAHLCHPAMIQDDVTGVVAGIEVMRRLALISDRRYTYRFLVLPETIGSICWLSSHEHLHKKIVGGLFLEMLGIDNPIALQLSYDGNAQIDKVFKQTIKEKDPYSWYDDFNQIIGNDERQFNSPGIRIPMLSMSRVYKKETGLWPYPQYHSSHDNMETLSIERLVSSINTAFEMLRNFEMNKKIVNKYKGEVFCSRYNMHIDFYKDPQGNENLFKILGLIDGTNSVIDIVEKTKSNFSSVSKLLNKMIESKLVEMV